MNSWPGCIIVCVDFSGGRKIIVEGTGFLLVQKAVVKVLPSADEFNLLPSNAEVNYIYIFSYWCNIDFYLCYF